MVQRGRAAGRARRSLSCAREHGDPPVGLWNLGAHAGRAGPDVQGHRARERLLPPPDPDELHRAGEGACGGLQARARRGDPRRREGARGAPRSASHLGDDHLRDVCEVGAVLPRPPRADQPVGKCDALGAQDPAVSQDHGVPLAGGPHRARDPRGGRRGDARYPGPLPAVHGGVGRASRRDGAEIGVREVCRRPGDVHLRGDDAGPAGAPGRHVAPSGAELCPAVRSHLPE